MKYIKTYEDNNEMYKIFEPDTFIVIHGNIDTISEILKKVNIFNSLSISHDLVYYYKDRYKIYGIYISTHFMGNGKPTLNYWAIDSFYDIDDGKNNYIDDGYTFKGEVKLINNKIILDTLNLNIDKYNL